MIKCISCGHGIREGTERQHKNYHPSCYKRMFKYKKYKKWEKKIDSKYAEIHKLEDELRKLQDKQLEDMMPQKTDKENGLTRRDK